MAKAYPELCASTHESAKKTKEQMLHDTFLGAIDNAMSRKIKSDSKHRDLNLTQLSEELDRLELIYKTTAPKVNLEVNNFKTTGEAEEISLIRKIIREEVAAALPQENDGSRETEDETKRTVGFVGKRNIPPKPRSGKTGGWEQSSAKINSFSAAKKFITLTGTVVQSGSREFKHEFVCDSGAEVSVIPTALAQEHYMKIQPTTRHVEMANGTLAECRGVVQTSVTVGTNSCILSFFVVSDAENGILGLDSLEKLGVSWNTKKKLATIDGAQPVLQLEVYTPQEMLKCCHIQVSESRDIKPFEEIFIW
ncbi:Hypothetical predicted protein [Paramuricea clavata]|uniref:Uncharacterized protein n=1 Tax=Paramuricea clavata TaxID=317549 RepID=A0A7D9JDQ2_PARCT|nr:Hypothetical predicted protein [Paramuricea clavata]